MSGPLAGRRALVTGGASGIGEATALRLGANGASVCVNYVGDAAPAGGVVAEIEGTAIAVEGDVSDEDAVQALFEQAQEGLGGPIDLLVNNAGVEKPYALEDMPVAEWQRVLDVNLTGPFLCSRELVRRLPDECRPASIVNVSSVHEVIPWPTFSHYCASKGGLKLFAQTIARELAPRGIRVALVAPGAILTPINRQLVEDPEQRREQEGQIPLGRMGEPEEIAGAIAWLAGPEAEYVVGTTLFVDGGMTLYPRFV
ncbi:MAG: glucose 1-dehydrogenase [Thermoleophilaceae bacterium]